MIGRLSTIASTLIVFIIPGLDLVSCEDGRWTIITVAGYGGKWKHKLDRIDARQVGENR